MKGKHIPYESYMGSCDPDIYFDEENTVSFGDTSITEAMRVVADACKGKPGRLQVITCWLNDFNAASAHSHDGLVTGIAKKTGLHRNTVIKHIKAIQRHKILKKVFKYRLIGGNEDAKVQNSKDAKKRNNSKKTR